MPNTLAHIGIHVICSKAVFPALTVKWMLLGAVIPDLPFVAKRAASFFFPELDVLDLRLWAIPQASLVYSLILAYVCSVFSTKQRKVFLLLSFGVLLHLLADACQIKWGNGPRLLVPFSLSILNFDLFWPEQWPSHLLSASGVLVVLYLFSQPLMAEAEDLCSPRLFPACAAAVLLLIYLFSPYLLMDRLEAEGAGDVRLIRQSDRAGEFILMDRANFKQTTDGLKVELFAGEFLDLSGIPEELPTSGKISVKGTFVSHRAIRAEEYHINSGRFRELASMFGLFVIAVYWVIVIFIKSKSLLRVGVS